MCLRPLTTEAGVQVSCRSCDECIGQRRFDWVSRAMAERAVSAQTMVLTLTYNEETQENRDGARFFRYADVRKLSHRIRSAIYHKTKKRAAFRFLVAGEQGDQFQRVHWHAVFFTDVDLLTLGQWVNYKGEQVTDPERIISPIGDKPKFRLNWSLWPHGYTVAQLPDEGGLHYALSYALKDQFAVDKAGNDRRITRAENYGTGVFRMSKNPPIGGRYLDQLIAELAASGQVLPATKVQVPDLRGYWFPRGVLRKRLLEAMAEINDASVADTGKPCSQWSSLVASCADNPSDLEVLLHGQSEEDEASVEWDIGRKSREHQQRLVDREIAQRCGGKLPCVECCRAFSADQLGEFGLRYSESGEFEALDGQPADFEARGSGLNRGCYLNDAASRRRVFLNTFAAASSDGAA